MPQRRFIPFMLSAVLCIVVFSHQVFGGGDRQKKVEKLSKTQTNDHYAPILINNIYNFYSNNGDGSLNPETADNEGFEFPKGSGGDLVFEDGVVWGGFQQGVLKASGSTYFHGLQAGRILTPGTLTSVPIADDPSLTKYRVYRVRPDVNPSTPFVGVQALLDSTEQIYTKRFISSMTSQQIYDQYVADWNQWPAGDGAPFKDLNGNGIYDPGIDIPGVPGASQTLWFIANDLDSSRSVSYHSRSKPMGFEIQRTIWAYNVRGPAGNTIFISTKLVNKSAYTVDSMFVSQWSDVEIGGALGGGDDFVGCDTLRNLGFGYNGTNNDGFYGEHAPALGYVLLQGPLIPGTPTDTGMLNGSSRPGFKNLGMTAYVFMIGGNATYSDPINEIQFYNVMTGLYASKGTPFVDPLTGRTTKYVLAGDPVTSQGWLDGIIAPPGDRRFMFSSGPFHVAPGDTQEIVVASIAAQGSDRIASVAELKSTTDQIRAMYNSQFRILSFPRITVTPTFSPGQNSVLRIVADCRGLNTSSVTARLRQTDGSLVATVQLYDDGAHGDSVSADGIFTNAYAIPPQAGGLTLDADIVYSGLPATTLSGAVRNITTTGPVNVVNAVVVSDNLNSDGVANPGESVRFAFTLANGSNTALTNVFVTSPLNQRKVFVGDLGPFSENRLVYDPSNSGTYFDFIAPSISADSSVDFPIRIWDSNGNYWSAHVSFPVRRLVVPILNRSIIRGAGNGTGDLAISIVDPTKVKNHVYKIFGLDSTNSSVARGYRIVDSTAGIILLDNHPVPDPLGHTSPVVDGFKVLIGNMDTSDRAATDVRLVNDGHYVQNNLILWYLPNNLWGLNTAGSTSYLNALSRLNWQGAAGASDYEIRVTATLGDTYTGSKYYYGSPNGAIVAGDQVSAERIPIEIWNNTTNKRLLIKVVDDNGNGTYDETTWATLGNTLPSSYGTSSKPFERIYASDAMPYTEPLPAAINEDTTKTARIGRLVFVDIAGKLNFFPPVGTVIRIFSKRAISSVDSWSFNPSQLFTITDLGLPTNVVLPQNYPNPFNPSTNITFSIPVQSDVKLKVFNLLGQEITTIFEGKLNLGPYTFQWDGTNQSEKPVASGVYFYRLQAGDVVQSKKMLLLR